MILRFRSKICFYFVASFVLAFTLVIGRILPQTMEYPEQYTQNTWHVGDSFFYQGLGEWGSDISCEIAGKTTWRGHEVFNLTRTGEHIENESYLHTIGMFELIGRYSVYKGGELEKQTTTADVFTDLPISEYSEGNYVVNETQLVDMKYWWNKSLPDRESYTRFSSYRVMQFSTLNISSRKITTPAGTFDCWELMGKTLNRTLNRTIQEVGGKTYLKNEYSEYSYIDSTTTQVDTWINESGEVEFESHSYETLNTSSYVSKSLRILVKSLTYRFDEENNTWVLYTGRELTEFNQITPTTTTNTTSSSAITPIYLIPTFFSVVILIIKRGKKC